METQNHTCCKRNYTLLFFYISEELITQQEVAYPLEKQEFTPKNKAKKKVKDKKVLIIILKVLLLLTVKGSIYIMIKSNEQGTENEILITSSKAGHKAGIPFMEFSHFFKSPRMMSAKQIS